MKKGKHINFTLLRILGLAMILAGVFATFTGQDTYASKQSAEEKVEDGFRSGVKVFIVPIHGAIDVQTTLFVKRCISQAKSEGAEYFILDIDTPGGLVSEMEEIGKDIANLEDDEIKTVAFVNNQAISAGAYLCLSCDVVLMARSSNVGSSAPILVSPIGGITELSKETREKFLSYLRGIFRSMAKRNGRSPDLAEAMVDQSVWIQWATIEKDGKTESIVVKKARADDMKTGKEKDVRFKSAKDIVTNEKLLNLDYKDAVTYGFADKITKDRSEVFAYLKISNPEITEMEPSFTEGFFIFLHHPLLRTLLFILGMGGIIMELFSPGFGVPGIVGISAIGLMMLISFSLGTANMWEMLLVFAGVVLLALEIFVIPGFGVAGIAGIICIFAGIVLSLLPFTIPQTDWAWDYMFDRIRDVAIAGVGTVIVIVLLARLLPETPFLKRLTLTAEASVKEGFVAAPIAMKSLLGHKGVSTTKLRPVGKADFDGELYQVVAEGDFVEANEQVEVIEVSANTITVRKAD